MSSRPDVTSIAAPKRELRQIARSLLERSGLGPVMHGLRRMPDQALHGWRQHRVLSVLHAAPLPGEVLFVCQGNIYRSPYAAYAFSAALAPALRARVRVTSAGFVGPGRSVPPAAQELAAASGLKMHAHRSSLLTPERVRSASLIVVMEVSQQKVIRNRFQCSPHSIVVLGDLDPAPIRTRTITDPWNQPPHVLRDSYGRIDRCVQALAAALL